MKSFRLAFAATAIALAPVAASAQDGDISEGFNLIEEGAKLLLESLSDEFRPFMLDLATEIEPKLRDFAEQMAPMLEEFSELVDDLDMYHAPERMPNGDIILRRKTPQELEESEENEVEL